MSRIEYSYIGNQQSRRKILKPSASFNSFNIGGSKLSKLSQINIPLKNQPKPNKPSIVFEQKQITEQLQKEILQIQKCLINYQPFLKHLKQKQSNKTIKQQIFSLQDLIKFKDQQMDSISQQIQNLKQVNKSTKNSKFFYRQEENYFNEQNMKSSHQDQNENIHFKLAQELKVQRQLLQKIQSEHQHKRSKLIQITSNVHEMELKFIQRCKKTKQKFVSYEQFKQLNAEKKKQIQNKPEKKPQKTTVRPRQSSIKQAPFTSFTIQPNHQNIQPLNNNKKTLKDLQNRKLITQQALKNSKKKHNNQLRQLHAKIQFLREQQDLLNQKIRQKQQEKLMLQAKFQERGGNFPFSSHRLFSPSIGPSRDFRLKTGVYSKSSRYQSPSNDSIKQNSQQKLQNHHFSPHRKLVSARKNLKQFEIDNEDYDAQYRPKEKLEKKQYHSFENTEKYNDYEQKTFNPQSKNSFRQPSTNLNDSNLQNY